MKLTLKIFLVICLFSSMAFGDDGDQGNGGKNCPPQQTCFDGDQGNGGKTEIVKTDVGTSYDGDQGNGGRTVNDPNESVLTFIQEYLMSIFE
jgi:hypothetical protein